MIILGGSDTDPWRRGVPESHHSQICARKGGILACLGSVRNHNPRCILIVWGANFSPCISQSQEYAPFLSTTYVSGYPYTAKYDGHLRLRLLGLRCCHLQAFNTCTTRAGVAGRPLSGLTSPNLMGAAAALRSWAPEAARPRCCCWCLGGARN